MTKRSLTLLFNNWIPKGRSGIEPNDMDFLFDPFFTRKERGHGLGLTVVHQIIKNHNGFIEVRSKAGEGTSVEIRLPA